MKDVFEKYLSDLRAAYREEGTEHSGRTALENLLNAFAAEQAPPANVQHEPKHVAEKGAPDFKVSRQGMILGYVENKAIGENLDKVLKSDQIKRYRTLSDNILLTACPASAPMGLIEAFGAPRGAARPARTRAITVSVFRRAIPLALRGRRAKPGRISRRGNEHACLVATAQQSPRSPLVGEHASAGRSSSAKR